MRIPLRADALYSPELAVRDALLPVGRGELYAVSGWELPFRFPIQSDAMKSVGIVGKLLTVFALQGE